MAIAAKELLLARVRHATRPTGQIVRELRQRSLQNANNSACTACDIDIQRLSWAISVAAARVPWRSDCLIQAMAAVRWLRRHHLLADFHLGVAKDEQGGLKAHAWLCYGDLTVTGGQYDEFIRLIEPPAN